MGRGRTLRGIALSNKKRYMVSDLEATNMDREAGSLKTSSTKGHG